MAAGLPADALFNEVSLYLCITIISRVFSSCTSSYISSRLWILTEGKKKILGFTPIPELCQNLIKDLAYSLSSGNVQSKPSNDIVTSLVFGERFS